MFNILSHTKRRRLFIFFYTFCFLAVSQNKERYISFLDSANKHINANVEKSILFLDSIPKPLEEHIAGRISEYYALKSLISDDYNKSPEVYQNLILALKYAEKEENYKIAGEVCLELCSDLYFFNKDSSANKYLERAKDYYEKCSYKRGTIEVEQMISYAKFINSDYKGCNTYILKRLRDYKDIKDDGYFYLFALYMLTSNYLFLDDFDNARNHFKTFKTLERDTTIVPYNYKAFNAALHVSFAEVFLKKKKIDSAFVYLDKLSGLRSYMGEDVIKDYFGLYVDAHNYQGNLETSKAYLDSLKIFEEKKLEDIVNASFNINNSLLNAESKLEIESEKSYVTGLLVVVLFCVLTIVSIVYFVVYRKHKFKINDFINQMSNFSYLKTNNEKLTVKIYGLEEYINNIRKDVKKIAAIDNVTMQKEQIKDLYKTLHLNSSTILDKSDNHLKLINDLNIDFFKRLSDMYPQLNNSEVIICYYLFIDFKNKEIAVFLNMSVRAIESKRYRITKKINLDKEKTTLVKHLKKTFKDTANVLPMP